MTFALKAYKSSTSSINLRRHPVADNSITNTPLKVEAIYQLTKTSPIQWWSALRDTGYRGKRPEQSWYRLPTLTHCVVHCTTPSTYIIVKEFVQEAAHIYNLRPNEIVVPVTLCYTFENWDDSDDFMAS